MRDRATIRPAQSGDAAGLTEFARSMFEVAFGEQNDPEHLAATFGHDQQARELADPAAGSRNAGTVWLSVWQLNRRAIRFYERHAFRIVGSKEFVVGEDMQTDWVMSREVTAPHRDG